MSRRRLAAAVQAMLILFGGLLLGALAAVAGFALDSGVASAAPTPACGLVPYSGSATSTTGPYVAQIVTLSGAPLTLSSDGTYLFAQVGSFTATECSIDAGYANAGSPVSLGTGDLTGGTNFSDCTTSDPCGVAEIKFTAGPETSQTVILDESNLNASEVTNTFCNVTFTGQVSNATVPPPTNALFEIKGFPGENLTVGSDGINPGCGAGNALTPPSGIGSYTLVANGNNATLDAQGSGNANPTTLPVTFVAGTITASEVEDFEPATTGTTLDFSQVTSTCGCSGLTVNTSGAQEPLGTGAGSESLASYYAAATTTTVSGATDAVGVYYFATTLEADVTNFVGLTNGYNTTFLAGSTSGYSFTAPAGSPTGSTANFSAAAPVTVDLSSGTAGTVTVSGGTDNISGLTTVIGSNSGGNRFTAGPSPSPILYNFSAGGDSNTFVGGAGTDVFTANGDNNTFTAGTGTGTFNSTGTGNIIDFSALTSQVTVEVAADKTADSTYTWPTFGSTPATFKGSAGGTIFEAGGTGPGVGVCGGPTAAACGGYTFEGTGGTNVADFSAAASGVTVNLASGASGGTVSGLTANPSGSDSTTDSLVGLTTVTGSNAGNNIFIAGPGPSTYSFSASGNSNTFTGGAGNDTFTTTGTSNDNTFAAGTGDDTIVNTGTGSGNVFDFTNLTTPLTVNVITGTATSATATYTFLTAESSPATFEGSAGGTTFEAGNTGGYAFVGAGSSNTASFSLVSSAVTVNFSVTPGVVTIPGSTPDTISDISSVIGSDAGHNVFVVGTSSETFGDTGNIGDDTIDFTNAGASASFPLTVNVSGGTAQTSNGPVSNYTAVVGSAVYNFTNSTVTNGGDRFTTFIGAANGNTDFLAGGSIGAYTFCTSESATYPTAPLCGDTIVLSDSVSFAASLSGVTVNLAASTPADESSGTVTVPGGIDTILGLTTVTGSNDGNNTFFGGDVPTTFIATVGNGNTFYAGSASSTFVGSGSGNFVKFSGSTASPTGAVTVNVSGTEVGTLLSGEATAGSATYNFSSFGSSAITFLGGAGGTTFIAGSAGDTFNGDPAGINTLTFADASGSSLVFCVASSTPTGTACAASGQAALLGSVREPFTNITVFDGLPGGDTTFVAGDPAGDSFNATGSNNSADYSNAGTGVDVNLSAGTTGTVTQAGNLNTDTITGLTTVIGSANGGNTFTAGPAPNSYIFTGNGNLNTFTGGTGSDTFSSNGNDNVFNVGPGAATLSDTGTGNTINFYAVPTSTQNPLTVNVSGTAVGPVGNDTATAGAVTYIFTTGGAGFTTLDGSSSGNTHFDAPGSTGGYTFAGVANTGDNTVDFTANLSGIVANLSPTPEPFTTLPLGDTCTTTPTDCLTTGQIYIGSAALDTISGITDLVGSPFGPNTFYGGLKGTTFSSTSPTNTVSYIGLTSPGISVNLDTDMVSGTGTADTFDFAPGSTITIQGSTGNDTFYIGTTSVFLEGGGGDDTLNLSLVSEPSGDTTGVMVNLGMNSVSDSGSVAGTTIGGVTFTPDCGTGSAPDLCVTTVVGSKYDDTFMVNPAQAVMITEPSGQGTLDLSQVTTAATVTMPTRTAPGTVNSPAISFTGIANVIGTMNGGDTFIVTPGTESFTENGATPGTLSFASLPVVGSAGVTVSVNDTGGFSGGTADSSPLGVDDTFTNIGTFIGTSMGNDTFIQTDASPATGYDFEGGGGAINTLDLSGAPSTSVTFTPAGSQCATGTNDGTTSGGGVDDTFSCMTTVTGAGAENFSVSPGQTATVYGGGNGTLNLVNDVLDQGVVVTLPNGTALGSVTGDGYDFEFTGMSTINGTPYNDLFIPGSGNVTINGGGGSDGVSFLNAIGPVVVNLSNSSYTVSSGFAAGTTVSAFTAVGGDGGVITLNGISNIIGTSRYNDILIAGSGPGTLVGGSGNDHFVLTGGTDFINGGTGSSTLDLSELPGQTELDLGSSALQFLGAGSVSIVPGTIETVIASPGGSQLSAGPGNITLVGGAGNDWLAAGTGTQTLMGNGGDDTLLAGVGTDNLDGGAQPVTFVPGQGTDNLSSLTTGNTLSYSGAPSGVQVNLSIDQFEVPHGPTGATEPFYGTVLPGQTATGGWGATVDLAPAGITTVVGSAQADIFVTGSGGGDTIIGNGGNDLFVIESGNNTLTAGTGSDSRFLFEGAGSNIINGGGDSTVDFSQAPAGVVVNLQSGEATGAFGGTQSLSGILNAIGTPFNDILVAGAPGGTLIGLDGADLLEAGPSGGDILVSDGSGNDTFCAESGSDPQHCAVAGTTSGGPGNVMIGGSGVDTFFAVNGFADTINGGAGGANSDTLAYVDSEDVVVNIPPGDIIVQ